MAKRLGIIPHRYAQPAFHGLKGRPLAFNLVEDHAAILAVKLRERHLDGAFLSPIDYAREYQMYRIVPSVAVTSEGESGSVLVFFKEHLHDIRSLAVDPRSSSEIVLAHLVFAEKYGTVPQIIPVSGMREQALGKADAVLLVGDEALAAVEKPNKIDLVDEWTDITGLPFVHGVWVARDHALSSDEMRMLAESAKKGSGALEKHSLKIPAGYLDRLRYSLTEKDAASLTEFFRMAYYHGVLEDLPDVKFHSLDGAPEYSTN